MWEPGVQQIPTAAGTRQILLQCAVRARAIVVTVGLL
jgi:hypothetical protein